MKPSTIELINEQWVSERSLKMSTRYDDRDDRDYDRDSAYYGQYNRRSSLDNTRAFGERAENRWGESRYGESGRGREGRYGESGGCLLYTSDAADERSSVDLGG